jgi:trehalose/maltose transport system substrate-binding protein
MEKERAAGNSAIWGYVFQGAPYEGLTCNALEWIASSGGGSIVDPDGTVTADNPKAAAALDRAHSWIGTIAPPDVLNFTEEESRAVWQAGNAVFMRNWPYAFALGNATDSAIRGRFDIAPLPAGDGGSSAATLGGWSLALSRNSSRAEAATALIRYLAAPEAQAYRALRAADLPTLPVLYGDKDISEEQPAMAKWKSAIENAVLRPVAVTGAKYDEVSKEVWTAVYETLSGRGSATQNLAALKEKLEHLRGAAW